MPPERLPSLYESLLKRWPEAQVNGVDGLRLDWEKSWVHVRPSNTEPIVDELPRRRTRRRGKLCSAVGEVLRETA